MAAPIVRVNDVIVCTHGGVVKPLGGNPRVRISGESIVVMNTPGKVIGCAQPPPPAGPGPCMTAIWTCAAQRVKASGIPVVTMGSVGLTTPTGTAVVIGSMQPRVRAT